MKFFRYLVYFIFLILQISAQVEFDFSGYWVNMPVYTKVPAPISSELGIKSGIFNDINRFRLRPTVFLWDGGKISLEYEIISSAYNGNFQLVNAESINSSRQVEKLRWVAVSSKNFRMWHFIDRLYFRQNFSSSSLVVGRQRISWGTGRIWNPTDLFNPVNPADFTKIEKDGADAVSYKYTFGSFTDAEFVYNPAEKFKKSNFAGRFRSNIGEYDFSVMGGKFDSNRVAGFDFAGNLFDAGLRGEAAVTLDKLLKYRYVKFIAGIDNQFTPELYALIEYHFNGEGKSKASDYEIEKLASGSIINLAKNYICLSGNYLIDPLTTLNFSATENLDDGGGFITPSINYSLTENFFINAGLQISFGKEGSEYWYYGNSFFLKTEYYF